MQVINPIIRSSLKWELPIRLLRSSIRRNTSNRKTTEYLPVAGCNTLWRLMAREMCPTGVDWKHCQGLQHNQTVLNHSRIKFKCLMNSTQTLMRCISCRECWKFHWWWGLRIPVLPLTFVFVLTFSFPWQGVLSSGQKWHFYTPFGHDDQPKTYQKLFML